MIFSERYKDLIDVGHGEYKDYICGEITFAAKMEIFEVLSNFAEPAIIRPNRYDSYEVNTNALHLAIDKLNEITGFQVEQSLRLSRQFGQSVIIAIMQKI
jgi:hypothetical protein